MRKRHTMLACAVFVALAGCSAFADKWTTEVVEVPGRGDKPTNPEPAIKAWLDSNLKDPFSAQIRKFSPPVEGFSTRSEVLSAPNLVKTSGLRRETRTHGWIVTAEVNAKNGYGAYVGWKPYKFIIREGVVISGDG